VLGDEVHLFSQTMDLSFKIRNFQSNLPLHLLRLLRLVQDVYSALPHLGCLRQGDLSLDRWHYSVFNSKSGLLDFLIEAFADLAKGVLDLAHLDEVTEFFRV